MSMHRRINLVLCLVGLVLAAPLYYLTPSLFNDASIQVSAATHLLHGKGYVKYQGWNGDFKTPVSPVLEPVEGWPPGYSLLLAASSAIFGNPVYIRLALLLLAALTITLCCFYIGETLLAPYPWIATGLWLSWIIWSFPPIFNTDSDNFALAAFSLGTVGMFKAWRNPLRLRWAFFTAVALAASAWLRFAYWCVLPVFALTYLFSVDRSRATYRWLTVHLTTLAVLVLPLFIYQKMRIGHYSYLGAWKLEETVYHWNYLRLTSAFPFFVVAPDFHIPPVLGGYKWLGHFPWILGSAILLAAMAWSFRSFIRKPVELRVRGAAWLAGLSFSTTVGMLVYCTVTTKTQSYPWVYLAEPRYFAVAILMFFFLLPRLLAEIQLRHRWLQGVVWLGYLTLTVLFAPRHWTAIYESAGSISPSWKRQRQAASLWSHIEPKVNESSCVYLTDEDFERLKLGTSTGAIAQQVETLLTIAERPHEPKCSVFVVMEKGENPRPETQTLLDRLKKLERIELRELSLVTGDF